MVKSYCTKNNRTVSVITILAFIFFVLNIAQCWENVNCAEVKKTERTPKIWPPLVFPRMQRYNNFMNYCHNHHVAKWIDRPLFFDRAMLEDEDYGGRTALFRSLRQTIKSARMTGVSGIGTFWVRDISNVSDLILGTSRALFYSHVEVGGYSLGGNKSENPAPQKWIDQISAGLGGLRSVKVDGKLLVTSYCADRASPKDLKACLDDLKNIFGDKFYFVADLRCPDVTLPNGRRIRGWNRFMDEMQLSKDHTLPAEKIDALKGYIRSYLDVCDGVMFAGSNHVENKYLDRRLDRMYYKFMANLFKEVLSEEKYKGKFFGLSAAVCYVNHYTASTEREEGTRALRDSMEIALEAKPDFIIMPEWNEWNENTAVMPTVYRSLSTQRIIYHYTRMLLPGRSPIPFAGDDTSIPNLIVSTRRVIRLGEPLEIELLAVPDTGIASMYSAKVSLLDENGNTVKEFEKVELPANELKEKWLQIPSEQFSAYRALYPVIEVISSKGKTISLKQGLSPIRIRPTWNWNYHWVKQPLRDMALDAKVSFEFAKSPSVNDKKYLFECKVKCDEEISSIEIMEDENEVYGYDVRKEYETGKDEAFIFANWNSRKQIKPCPVTITVENGKFKYYRNMLRGLGPREEKFKMKSNTEFTSFWKINCNRRGVMMVVTNKDNAVLNIKTPVFETKVKVSDILAKRFWTGTFTDHAIKLRMEVPSRMMDIPVPVNKKEVNFVATVAPRNAKAVYNLRIVTKTGKVFRSKPLLSPLSGKEESIDMSVFSETENKPVTVKADKRIVPQFNYEFSSFHGDKLECSMGRDFDAGMGGGFAYGGTFMLSAHNAYPKDIENGTPVWKKEGNNEYIHFDGNAKYLWLPKGVMPRGAFNIKLKLRSASEKDMIILYSKGSLKLKTEGGKLVVVYYSKLKKSDKSVHFKAFKYNTGLKLPVGKWVDVELAYDFENITVKLDGKEGKPFKLDRQGFLFFANSAIGGYGIYKDKYFTGDIGKIEITHLP